MKQITKSSRLLALLERMFRDINHDFFNDELDTPVITVTPSPKCYGYYTAYNAWETKGTPKREINISSGTLNRPIEDIFETLLHECIHFYNDTILNTQDTSRQGHYHNKHFKNTAESHGLLCKTTKTYGWSITELTDESLEYVWSHDEYKEVEMNRSDGYTAVAVGNNSRSNGLTPGTPSKTRNRSLRYICPKCNTIIRANKIVSVICGNCLIPFEQR